MSGRVEALWTKRAFRGPMDVQHEITCIAGKGIEGNACISSTRQVTIIVKEQWDTMMEELNAQTDPSARRANVMVSGVTFAGTRGRGRVLRLGGVRVRIRGETRPCERMDEALPGLRAAMDADWRAGAFGEVLDDGLITIGDTVEWDAAP